MEFRVRRQPVQSNKGNIIKQTVQWRQEAIEKWNVRVPVNSHDELLESAKDAYEQLRLINSVSSKDEDLQTKLESMEMLEKAITASLGKEME